MISRLSHPDLQRRARRLHERQLAGADAFLFASATDTLAQVILEAQASGLPVVAVDAGGPASLITSGETGLLTSADPEALAAALLAVTSTPLLAQRLREAGLAAVRKRVARVA